MPQLDHQDKTIAQIIAELTHGTAEQIEPYLDHPDVYLRVVLAGMPQLSREQVTRLANDNNHLIRISTCSRKNLPLDLQHQLARDRMLVREALAKNSSLAPEIMELLFSYSVEMISGRLAANPSCSTDLQLRLAMSGGKPALRALAKRSDITPALGNTLFKAAVDHDSTNDPVEMRHTTIVALANNPATPSDLLTQLATSVQLSKPLKTFINEALLDNPNTPHDLLRGLQSTYLRGHVNRRSVLASTPHTPLLTLARLASSDKSLLVRQKATETLERITDHIIETQLASGTLSLNQTGSTSKKTLGDCLLQLDMTALYQRIQGLELTRSIEHALQATPVELTTPASSALRRRL
ncbi:TPA: hypothetical protein ACJ51G_000996 [Aeromonas hydrophila subsp. hydrophila]